MRLQFGKSLGYCLMPAKVKIQNAKVKSPSQKYESIIKKSLIFHFNHIGMDFAEIDHLLELARLELSGEEKEEIAKDLEKILGYIDQLQTVKTGDLEPMTGGTFSENILRQDEINPLKSNLEKDGYFIVPPIF